MPDWAPHVRARLASIRLSPTRETEIVDELSQHLEDRYRELIAGGTSPDEATRLALADFQGGNVLGQKMASLRQGHVTAPTTLGAPTGHVVSDLWQDVRYATRIFWKQPAFAATAVLMLALGIGATTAIFSVVHGVLLKPLPFHEPDRLVSLRQHAPHGVGTNHGPATYLTYRENQQAFEAIGAWNPTEVSITAGGGNPERVQALQVSATTLPLLRVQPVIGRVFSTEDDTPGNPLRVVLTLRLLAAPVRWRQRTSLARRSRSTAGRAKSSVCSPRRSRSCAPVPKSCCPCRWTPARLASSASGSRRSRG